MGETQNKRTAKKAHRESFSTHEGHALTPNENAFISKYVETGNGRQSYLESYPNSNPKTAAQMAQRMLNKEYINSEIKYRMESVKQEGIANAEEILQYFTGVMRGEIQDQFGLDAPLGERTKAAQELAKRLIDIPNRLNGNEQNEVRIVVDWSRDNGDKD